MKQNNKKLVYPDMKCERAIPGTEIIVDRIWEVRIEFDIWRGIQEAAKLNDCTFSWVVRWCIFSALKTKDRKSFKTAVMELHNRRNLGAAKRESHHRFSL
ncbi:MAG: hypothetical protein KDK41_17945 [Leptospiraceae bacterium]|nr:hypothetical protein [Leptospiraceae bacterium]